MIAAHEAVELLLVFAALLLILKGGEAVITVANLGADFVDAVQLSLLILIENRIARAGAAARMGGAHGAKLFTRALKPAHDLAGQLHGGNARDQTKENDQTDGGKEDKAEHHQRDIDGGPNTPVMVAAAALALSLAGFVVAKFCSGHGVSFSYLHAC